MRIEGRWPGGFLGGGDAVGRRRFGARRRHGAFDKRSVLRFVADFRLDRDGAQAGIALRHEGDLAGDALAGLGGRRRIDRDALPRLPVARRPIPDFEGLWRQVRIAELPANVDFAPFAAHRRQIELGLRRVDDDLHRGGGRTGRKELARCVLRAAHEPVFAVFGRAKLEATRLGGRFPGHLPIGAMIFRDVQLDLDGLLFLLRKREGDRQIGVFDVLHFDLARRRSLLGGRRGGRRRGDPSPEHD